MRIMPTLKLDSLSRVIGSFLIVISYFIVLHVSTTIGAAMYLVSNFLSIPYFIRTKGWDVVVMLSFLIIIGIAKLA
tara:strand:+ start:68 stop:295 length:228 start_codon:yes stop_codon:yes gene_type:complete